MFSFFIFPLVFSVMVLDSFSHYLLTLPENRRDLYRIVVLTPTFNQSSDCVYYYDHDTMADSFTVMRVLVEELLSIMGGKIEQEAHYCIV